MSNWTSKFERKLKALSSWELKVAEMRETALGSSACCPACMFGDVYVDACNKVVRIREELDLQDPSARNRGSNRRH